ncbi:c-type cytochrome [Rudanella lutea]|uniref:c-type cytochrome n=1 Tax=Rudanella lutea TaxID=451374 RepID=UPI0003687D8E|nr:c-type cytochrome [Rudanella lutea]
MKKAGRIIAIVLGVLVLFVGAGLAYVKLALPNVGPPPEITIRADSAQIAHGKYLAHHVALCMDCHSTRDWTKLAGPMVAGTNGKGGEGFLRTMGFPGDFYAPNITPARLKEWTDGEIFRAVTTGVSRDGRALFPVMPYQNYAKMDPQDIRDIIAYVRTLAPIENQVPAPDPDFPMNFIMHTIPAKAEGGQRPQPTDELAYGKYLTTMASCGDCHTPVDDKAQPLPGMEMAGGREFPMPTGTVRSMNLTPDETGIKALTKEAFVARFKAHDHAGAENIQVGEDEFNSLMPWTMYAGMSEQDLGAIYTYLASLKPIKHKVERFTPRSKLMASR